VILSEISDVESLGDLLFSLLNMEDTRFVNDSSLVLGPIHVVHFSGVPQILGL
jgi:hypothetical protein